MHACLQDTQQVSETMPAHSDVYSVLLWIASRALRSSAWSSYVCERAMCVCVCVCVPQLWKPLNGVVPAQGAMSDIA